MDQPLSDPVQEAVQRQDWDALRKLSLAPGGFGSSRVNAWRFLLNVKPVPEDAATPSAQEETITHKDERQVGLDTDRSFVLYPVESQKEKDDLKAQLHEMIVHVLHKRPKLSYFQGYHDILSVLMLTFTESDQQKEEMLAAAEKLSLQRLRDSMGPGLEPLVGLLRLLKRLLRMADPEYSKLLSTASPLPYFALSNLLTYFSHDVPTLPLIQHIFDFILSHPPIIIVYLATVMLLVRKPEVEKLFESGDEGMLHALLCTLPDLEEIPKDSYELLGDSKQLSSSEEFEPFVSTEDAHQATNHDRIDNLEESWTSSIPEETELSLKNSSSPTLVDHPSEASSIHDLTPTSWAESSNADTTPSPDMSPSLAPISLLRDSLFEHLEPSSEDEASVVEKEPLQESTMSLVEAEKEPKFLRSDSSNLLRHPPRIPLSRILEQTEELFRTYPPSALQVSQIMGPQSVLFTWSEQKSELPSDDMAERMVLRPELVVTEFRDEDEEESDRIHEQRKNAGVKKNLPPSHYAFGRGTKLIIVGSVVVAVLGVAIVYGNGKNGEWRRLRLGPGPGGWFGRR